MPNHVVPSKKKNLRGTYQKCREESRNTDISVVTKIPPAPRWLATTAKKLYRDHTEHLKFMQILDVVGLPLVVAYCIEMAAYLDGVKSKKPRKETDPALANALKIGQMFGLDPVSKSKVRIDDKNKKVEGMEEFL